MNIYTNCGSQAQVRIPNMHFCTVPYVWRTWAKFTLEGKYVIVTPKLPIRMKRWPCQRRILRTPARTAELLSLKKTSTRRAIRAGVLTGDTYSWKNTIVDVVNQIVIRVRRGRSFNFFDGYLDSMWYDEKSNAVERVQGFSSHECVIQHEGKDWDVILIPW